MSLEDEAREQVENHRSVDTLLPRESPTPKAEDNGVKTYAKFTLMLSVLAAVILAAKSNYMVAVYVVSAGVGTSVLFFALGAIVDRLNDIINLLRDQKDKK